MRLLGTQCANNLSEMPLSIPWIYHHEWSCWVTWSLHCLEGLLSSSSEAGGATLFPGGKQPGAPALEREVMFPGGLRRADSLLHPLRMEELSKKF